MPIGRYFKGSGTEVMGNMQKQYGAKKGKQVFYATANAKGMTPASKMPKGATLSPKGDIGMYSVMEGEKAGKQFKGKGGYDTGSSYLPYRAPETAIDGKFGPGDRVC